MNLDTRMNNYTYTPEEAYYYGNKLFGLLAGGSLKVNTITEYPFTAEGVQRAHNDLAGGKTTGKLVIKVVE
jgi:NADPH:quinone reductase-like Zn-dependent oxidoreductase